MVTQLSVDNLSFSYGTRDVLRGITLEDIPPGQITAAIGPNAAGKSTLFKCIAGLLNPKGKIMLGGRDLREHRKEDVIRQITYLPQEGPVNAVLTVFEAVLLARKHSQSWRVRDDDLQAITRTLADVGIEDLATRFLNELSGGQKQMVSIAQALAREPLVLLLDEPTSSLDLQRQLEVLDLVGHLTAERGIVTLIALHDLNLAARYATRFVVMNQGTVYVAGDGPTVLTAAMLRDVYGVNATVQVGGDGVPQITPLSSTRTRAVVTAASQ